MRLLWPILFALIQTTNATISGTASDPTGARVPNAQITLENIETGVATVKTTNEAGVYVFASVPPDRAAFGVVLTQPGLVGANFAGSRIGALNVTRQGINVMDQLVNSGVNSVISNSVDVIDEVRVITSPVDAEFGRGSGQVHLSER